MDVISWFMRCPLYLVNVCVLYRIYVFILLIKILILPEEFGIIDVRLALD